MEAYLQLSCVTSGVPLHVEDQQVLLDVARMLA